MTDTKRAANGRRDVESESPEIGKYIMKLYNKFLTFLTNYII